MILGVGIDLCAIGRIASAIANPHFLERVYTDAECLRIDAAPDARRGEIAAGLFAAKEAAAKALGTGFNGFGFADIEVTPDDLGRPECRLYRRAHERAVQLSGGDYRIFVSITHEGDMAAATAVLEGG